jgi:hypothetical protein
MTTRIFLRNERLRRAAAIFGGMLCLIIAEAAYATHIPTGTDRSFLRPPMPLEGYLHFDHSAATGLPDGGGEERTGWTDIRHPALDGTLDTRRGYDWSDNQVVVLTHNVRVDPPAGAAGDTTVTAALRRQDFDVTNAAYAQAGITVRQEANNTILGNDIVANARRDVEPSLSTLFGNNRSANARTINEYYVDNIPLDFEGYALPPNYAANGGAAGLPNVYNNGFAVPDTTRNIANPNPPPAILPNSGSATFPHELGHFLLDDNRFTTGNTFHSRRGDDLMLASPLDPDPAAYKIEAEMFGLREPGQHVGNIGTHTHLTENVTNLAGGPAMTQTEAMYRSPFVQRDDNGLLHGDRAEFDWVEDNKALETATTRGDNHPGVDLLMWEIGPITTTDHQHNGGRVDVAFDHMHDGWGTLPLDRFAGDFFRTVDIVSQIARYSDMDVRSGEWSLRDSALDFRGCALNQLGCKSNSFFPEFSNDGVDWFAGSLINVFIPGWTANSLAEDFVSRWVSPIDATLIRLQGFMAGDHDGNVQIDAIIASRTILVTIGEPGTLLLFLLGIAAAGLFYHRYMSGAVRMLPT